MPGGKDSRILTGRAHKQIDDYGRDGSVSQETRFERASTSKGVGEGATRPFGRAPDEYSRMSPSQGGVPRYDRFSGEPGTATTGGPWRGATSKMAGQKIDKGKVS